MSTVPPSSTSLPVAIVGAGITGLTAAWELHRAGIPVTVFEASGRVGGVIGAAREGGWLHEAGPNTFLAGSPEAAGLIEALGLGSRRLYAAPAAKNRFVVRGGRLLPVPLAPGALLRTGLFSWRAKLGLLGEPFRRRRSGGGEESVADFIRRRLGPEILDYAVDPFVAGIYAGDPSQLSIDLTFPKLAAWERGHGSLLRGALSGPRRSGPRQRILSFPDGLDEIPAAIARALGGAVRLRSAVRAAARTAQGWRVVSDGGGGDFSAVICALPPEALAGLSWEGAGETSGLAALRDIAQPPVASVFTGFRRDAVSHPLDGFGFLVPRVERRSLLGCLFSSTLFPGRAPEDHVALTSFVGGARQPELALLGDDALLDLVGADLSKLLGARGRPAYVRIRRWPRAIPQYNLGHRRFLEACAAAEASAPGLFIGGNARDGVSLSACIDSGRRLAAAAASFIRPPSTSRSAGTVGVAGVL